jgi:peptidoglycan/xylan/chitin deacetylase (PgdA/CDA1 family)
MKKLLLAMLFSVLMLSACAEDQPTEQAEEEDQVQQEEEEAGTETEDQEEHDEENEEEISSKSEESEAEVASNEIEKEAKYYIDENASVVPLNDDTDENVVLLTIDDAPEENTLEMAETLKELDAGAIFFVNGHFLETPEQEEALKQLHEMGFIIGNHTYNHPVLTDISEEEQREEIISLSDRVEEIIGERPKFFRAPHGVNTDFSEALVEEEGMVLMNWTYGYDYFAPYQDAEKLTEAMVTGEAPEVDIDYSLLKPGANLLMHDREWTNEALGDIVRGLREQGYEIVDPHLIQELDEEV